MRQRVAVALSGGRDSTIAASLLLSTTSEVIGLHALMGNSARALAQCEQAREAARLLGIRFEVVDLTHEFARRVIEPFCHDYAAGRTPNPCVVCNREIKLGLLLRSALSLGADRLATGHYARVEQGEPGPLLLRATDHLADQSYFLYAVAPASLERLLTPLGDVTRAEVHRLASAFPTVEARSSRDICFVANRERARFIASKTGARPGDILDLEGRVVGQHRGLPFYTVGQRHGLRIAAAEPRYVVRLYAERNAVIVGSASDLLITTAVLDNLAWTSGRPASTELLVHAQSRYRSSACLADVSLQGENAIITFHQPQRAIAPGQSVVFYDADVVLGGGVMQQRPEGAE